jgi:hypothetical protein
MCSGCAGSYENGDEEPEEGIRHEARTLGTAPGGLGRAPQWSAGAANIRTWSKAGKRPAHFAAFGEGYEVFVGVDHIIEVRVVRANTLVTPALTASPGPPSASEEVLPPPEYYQTRQFRAAPTQALAGVCSVRLFFAALAIVWAAAVGAWLIIK